uniref:Uncharacterized protein n=1 Tax=Daucus carota subsp. sativus TaxID=79200 RepID=A0A166B4S9_DAUCS
MDLAVRASLQDWKFVFVRDVSVKNELPSTFSAYRFQEHCWSCGPVNLFKKMKKEIMLCSPVFWFRKSISQRHWPYTSQQPSPF